MLAALPTGAPSITLIFNALGLHENHIHHAYYMCDTMLTFCLHIKGEGSQPWQSCENRKIIKSETCQCFNYLTIWTLIWRWCNNIRAWSVIAKQLIQVVFSQIKRYYFMTI